MNPTEHFKTAGAALARLALALNAAEDAQWQAPPRFRPREDVTDRKALGSHADPTPAIALDELRLDLRDAVKHAEHIFELTQKDALKAERELIAALERWRGEENDD